MCASFCIINVSHYSIRGACLNKEFGTGLAPVDLVISWGFSLVNSALPNYPLSSHEDMDLKFFNLCNFQCFIILPVFSSNKTNPHLAVHQTVPCF